MRSLPPDAASGPRADILRRVTDAPGIHLRGIERATGLPLGQVIYHLGRLERMGLVNSIRDGGFRRYFLTRDIDRSEKRVFAAVHHDTPRGILRALSERPGQSHTDLRDALGVAGSTMTFHLHRLVDADVLERCAQEHGVVYALRRPDVVERILNGDPAGDVLPATPPPW